MKNKEQDVFAQAAAQMNKAFPPIIQTITQDKADLERLYPKGGDGKSINAKPMNTLGRYTRTEQPALLTAPVTLEVTGTLLAELNLYRQARHDYFSCPHDVPDVERIHRLQTLEHLGEQLASTAPHLWG